MWLLGAVVLVLSLVGCAKVPPDTSAEVAALRAEIARIQKGEPIAVLSPPPDMTEAPDCLVSVVDFSTQIDSDLLGKRLVLSVKVKNNSPHRVKAWRAVMHIYDAFGSDIASGGVREETSSIQTGKTATTTFEFRDNRFIPDEPFDRIAVLSKENTVVKLTDCTLSYGTK